MGMATRHPVGTAVPHSASLYSSSESSPATSIITNVRVFTGYRLSEAQTVVISGATIESVSPSASPTPSTSLTAPTTTIDGTGCTLLPGLIEAHAHPASSTDLEAYRAIGATTVAELGSPIADVVGALKKTTQTTSPPLPTLLSADVPATAPWGTHGRMMKLPASEMPVDPGTAAQFVGRRLERGADYIKAIADAPGMDQATLNALVSHARQNGVPSMVHASRHAAYAMAVRARPSMIHHVPMDKALDERDLQNVRTELVAVPTLVAMRAFNVGLFGGLPQVWDNAKRSVAVLRDAGVPILAGSDANRVNAPGIPQIGFGSALLDELDCLVEAGLSTVEALRAATVLPAKYFGLADRGVVAPGKRADLLLVDGDPLEDIAAVRRVKKIWIAGIECATDQKQSNSSDNEQITA